MCIRDRCAAFLRKARGVVVVVFDAVAFGQDARDQTRLAVVGVDDGFAQGVDAFDDLAQGVEVGNLSLIHISGKWWLNARCVFWMI